MGQVYNVNSVTADTFAHLQIGAWAFFVDFDYEGIDTADGFAAAVQAALTAGGALGGTSGNIDIEIMPEMHDLSESINDVFVPFVGAEVLRRWTCQMSATLKEFKKSTLEVVFPTAVFDELAPGITEIKLGSNLQQGHYRKNITWIARINQVGYIMVAMRNALGRTTGAITVNPDDSSNIPFQAVGHAKDLEDIEFAPADIWIVDVRAGGAEGLTQVKAAAKSESKGLPVAGK